MPGLPSFPVPVPQVISPSFLPFIQFVIRLSVPKSLLFESGFPKLRHTSNSFSYLFVFLSLLYHTLTGTCHIKQGRDARISYGDGFLVSSLFTSLYSVGFQFRKLTTIHHPCRPSIHVRMLIIITPRSVALKENLWRKNWTPSSILIGPSPTRSFGRPLSIWMLELLKTQKLQEACMISHSSMMLLSMYVWLCLQLLA